MKHSIYILEIVDHQIIGKDIKIPWKENYQLFINWLIVTIVADNFRVNQFLMYLPKVKNTLTVTFDKSQNIP